MRRSSRSLSLSRVFLLVGVLALAVAIPGLAVAAELPPGLAAAVEREVGPAAIGGSIVSSSGVMIVADDGAGQDYFGWSVSISGSTAVMGAAGDDTTAGANAGSAYVFVREGSGWSKQTKLTASDAAAGDLFGRGVAIDGDTVVIGAEGKNGSAGSAYVFTRSGTTWSEQATLAAADGAVDDYFGHSVAVSGGTALIGAYHDDTTSAVEAGSAHVFTRTGTTWSHSATLTADAGGLDDYFGWSVAISGDTLIVGSYADDTPRGDSAGSAYIFSRSGTAWSQEASITASDGAGGDQFGGSVCISGDTALVGAPSDDTIRGTDVGSAYFFSRSGTAWSQEASITASDGAASDAFGVAVALDGETALVGSNADVMYAGSAFVFSRRGGAWAEQAKLTASDAASGDFFGTSVALWGGTALVGAYFDDTTAGADAGSAWAFPAVTSVTRVPGSDRYGVAAEMARKGWRNADGSWDCTHVIVACGEDRAAADPLAAGGLAGIYDAPILLTKSASLPYATKSVIGQIAAANPGLKVHLVGGTLSVPDARWTNIRGISGVSTVKDRIAGATRYDVTAGIAKRMCSVVGSANIDGVIVVCAENPSAFYDALAASPISFDEHFPMLGVKKYSTPAAVGSVLNSPTYLGGKPRYAASGTGYIATGSYAERLATTTNRYTAATQIADKAISHVWLAATDTGVAAKLSDSLGGGAFMGDQGGVLLYTTSTNTMQTTTRDWIDAHRFSIERGWAFGGTTSFPSLQFTQFDGLLP